VSLYIDFRLTERSPGRKTDLWEVLAKDAASTILGWISFTGSWRKFVFYPKENTQYDALCLRDIADFCHEQTNAWRGEVIARKAR
jgi:hypothetical protein